MSLLTHPEQVLWEVSSIVDSSVHGDETLHGRLVLHVGVVEAGVEHDDGKRQDVTGVWRNTHTSIQAHTRAHI